MDSELILIAIIYVLITVITVQFLINSDLIFWTGYWEKKCKEAERQVNGYIKAIVKELKK